MKQREDEGAQREERLRLVRRNWNNPGPQSKENNQQLSESMNEAAFWGEVVLPCTHDVSWLMSAGSCPPLRKSTDCVGEDSSGLKLKVSAFFSSTPL